MGFSFKKLLPAVGAAVGLPFVGSTLLAGASSAMDYMSAQQQNRSAETMAKDQMAFSAGQARQQMDFQERMSSSAHQREVDDLKAAGLNPLLSLNQGADSPGGASGQGAMAPVVPELANISTSVKDAMRMWNEFRATKSQVDLAKANEIKTGVDTDLLRTKGPERELDERFYRFINDVLDRFGKTSPKSKTPSNLRNWFDPNRNELDTWIEDPKTRIPWLPGGK